MSTYAEYLKSMGASEDEIKVLVTPTSSKAFDRVQSEMAEQARLREIAQADIQKFQTWYSDEAVPSYQKMQQETIEARADAARNAELVKAARDQGLLELAKKNEPPPNPNPGHPDFDPNKYATLDAMKSFADGAGSGLAKMQDAVLEHMQLFPNQRLNVSALREEAVKAGKDFYTMWEQKYNVPAKREEVIKAAHDAELAAARKEGEDAATTKYVSQYGNPETRPMTPSTSPFAMRPATGRDKQPWEQGDKSGERVERATRKVMADVVH